MAWLDLTDDLSKEGADKVEVGQVLIFDFEGSPVHLQIMSKDNGKIKAKRLRSELFMTPEQADEEVFVVPKNAKFKDEK